MTIKLLFLTANPQETTRLQIDREMRAIDQALRTTTYRDRFELHAHGAVHYSDLQDLLMRYQPHIVHFSGHGTSAGELLLESESGIHPVSAEALSTLFTTLKDNIRCVVLNACYSQMQAQAIARYVDCVIGMSAAIDDTTSINFSAAFYRALGYGRSIKAAFDLGCNAINLANLANEDIPQLLDLHGDLAQVVLIPTHSVEAKPTLPAPGKPPFKGLQFFDIADAGIFFGRERLTAELVTYLHQHRFVAVVGASGSGKSSIVRAGLVPVLQRSEPLADGTIPPKGSNRWPVHIITPKAHPLEQLAATLTQGSESVRAQATLIDDLTQEPRSLHLYATRLLSTAASDRLLLVVDQFEELFTLCRDPQERQVFVDNLLTAAVDDGVTTVVITLRADFYHHCADFANLRQSLQEYQKYIGPMNEEELRRAIEEPARLGSWELEPGLIDLLLDDVAVQPGALPLLSHALLETWRRRRGRTLTLAGYTASGRVQGAIAQTAEAVLNQQLTVEQRSIARNIFLRLTELGEGVQDTRRRVTMDELLYAGEDADAIEKVIRALADARLITTDQDEVEVAHEALIREWQTLREWLDVNREWLRLHRRLTEAAQEWKKQNYAPDLLYQQTTLGLILEKVKGHEHELNELEHHFLKVSQEVRKAAEREKEMARRQAINRRRMVWIAASVFVILIVLNVFAFYLITTFQRNAEVNHSIALSANAWRALQDNNFDLALPLALAANQIVDPPALAINALAAAAYVPGTQRLLVGHTEDVTGVAFSPDGNFALTGSLDKSARIWDTGTGRVVHQLGPEQLSGVTSVAYSPGGEQALLGLDDGRLVVWDVASGELLRTLAGPSQGITEPVTALAYAPDGQRVMTGDDGGGLRLWDVTTGAQLLRLAGHEDGITAMVISPDGRTALSGGSDSLMLLWNLETAEEIQRFEGHQGDVIMVAYGPLPGYVLSGSRDNNVVTWSIESGKPNGGFTLGERTQAIGSIAVAPDSAMVLSGALDGSMILWSQPPIGTSIRTFVGNRTPVSSLAYSKDGRHVLSGSGYGEVRLWDILGPAQLRRFTIEPLLFNGMPIDPLHNLAIDEEHQRAFSGAVGGLILWNLETGAEIHRFPAPRDRLSAVALSPDGTTALSATNHDLTLWNLTTYEGKPIAGGHTAEVLTIAYTEDGQAALSASADGVVIRWNLQTARATHRLDLTKGNFWSVAFSVDGNRALTGAEDHSVILWDLATGQEIQRFEGHYDAVYWVALSPDGQTALSGSADRQVILWELATGKPIRTFQGHSLPIHTVAYSPNGHTILSGGEDNTVRLWDIATGAELYRFEGHGATIQNVIYLHKEPLILSRASDGTIILWQFPPLDQNLQYLDLAVLQQWTHDNRYVRELTCNERLLYNVEPFALPEQNNCTN